MVKKLKLTPYEQGLKNSLRVRRWFQTHLTGTQRECAKDLGLSVMTVNKHVHRIRAEWFIGSGQRGEIMDQFDP
jgi:hypothetical protein